MIQDNHVQVLRFNPGGDLISADVWINGRVMHVKFGPYKSHHTCGQTTLTWYDYKNSRERRSTLFNYRFGKAGGKRWEPLYGYEKVEVRDAGLKLIREMLTRC